MTPFIKRIEITENWSLLFSFNRIFTARGALYHVSVTDKSTTIFFKIEKENGKLSILDPSTLPTWLLALEDELSAIICNHYGNDQQKIGNQAV